MLKILKKIKFKEQDDRMSNVGAVEKVIKNSIAEKDFHGLVVNYDHRVEVFWWKEGSEIINKFCFIIIAVTHLRS